MSRLGSEDPWICGQRKEERCPHTHRQDISSRKGIQWNWTEAKKVIRVAATVDAMETRLNTP